MFDRIGVPLFAALARAAEAHLGPDAACTVALRAASATPEPALLAAAQDSLASLPEAQRNRILAEAQADLRLDPAMLAGALRPGGSSLH